jgi:urea transport system substrate-binding protein
VIYTGAAPNQQILPALDWFLTQQNKRRFFLVGSDYVFPRMANEIIKDHVLDRGGSIVGEAYLRLGSYDVNSIVAQVQQTRPDIILNTINGSSNVPFFSALRSVGITPDQVPTLSFSIGEAELRRLDIATMVGDYAAWNYFQSIDSPENKEFVNLFRAKYGPHHVLTDPMEAAYSGVLLWAQAATEAGSTRPKAIRRAIRGMRGSGPGGPLRIDAATQHAVKTPRIGKVRPNGQFEIVWTAAAAVAPEPYPSSRSAAQWRATLHDLYRNWGNRWSAPPHKTAGQASEGS